MAISLATRQKPVYAPKLPVYNRKSVAIYRVYADGNDMMADDAVAVLENLRPRDRHEFEALGLSSSVHGSNVLEYADQIYLAYVGDEPVFVFGVVKAFPHVAGIFGFGTPNTKRAIPAMTDFINRKFIPALIDEGVTRAEVRLPAAYSESILWLTESLAFNIECRIRGYAVTGEDYFQLARTIEA